VCEAAVQLVIRDEIAALPLKVVGGDAAPVRALLWRD